MNTVVWKQRKNEFLKHSWNHKLVQYYSSPPFLILFRTRQYLLTQSKINSVKSTFCQKSYFKLIPIY